jgi:CRP/FNR family transcriptional regulator, anaerobic regulatory protein
MDTDSFQNSFFQNRVALYFYHLYNMFASLFHHLKKYISLTAAEEEIIKSYLQVNTVANKEYILQQGQVCQANYFIINGCVRKYFTTDQGAEQIIQFAIDNWWITDYTSMDFQQPSVYTIQAVEESKIVILKKSIEEELFTRVPALERYFRIILQRAFAASLNRIHYIYSLSGEERYRHFSNAFPEFVQRVPQYMLASYLGFTPEFLSKIRARKG